MWVFRPLVPRQDRDVPSSPRWEQRPSSHLAPQERSLPLPHTLPGQQQTQRGHSSFPSCWGAKGGNVRPGWGGHSLPGRLLGPQNPRGPTAARAVPLPEDTSLLQAQQGRRWDGQEPSSLPCCPEDPHPGEAQQGSCGGPDSPWQKPPDTYTFMDTEKFVLKKKQSK